MSLLDNLNSIKASNTEDLVIYLERTVQSNKDKISVLEKAEQEKAELEKRYGKDAISTLNIEEEKKIAEQQNQIYSEIAALNKEIAESLAKKSFMQAQIITVSQKIEELKSAKIDLSAPITYAQSSARDAQFNKLDKEKKDLEAQYKKEYGGIYYSDKDKQDLVKSIAAGVSAFKYSQNEILAGLIESINSKLFLSGDNALSARAKRLADIVQNAINLQSNKGAYGAEQNPSYMSDVSKNITLKKTSLKS